MSRRLATIASHALTCAAAVFLADRVAAARRASVVRAQAAHVRAAEREPAAILAEIGRQVAIGRASFLAPKFVRPRPADAELARAGDDLAATNQEFLRFGEMIEAPRDAIDMGQVCALWNDFMTRRQAARDRWQARRRELERSTDGEGAGRARRGFGRRAVGGCAQ